ncbi:MAG: hypothetical protein IPN12_00240 [Rhodocyclaceae bacterium]|jgi:hypothetical protein|nr:hypothetical protein [Rhodocyclaceae bacterium]MBP7483071.1 hypothetical protein [Lacunisphaera sp.]MDQ5877806.1 hypothetical protein [Pseudomonadota bacterium]MBK9309175.1 hypothetical protein [Rhodocyclaceae bacterium]MDQ5903351.1 hypothetical protein [Pseudomonadota bacterium]
MPTISAWANELRAVFGAAEINAAIRQHGYYARENGAEVGCRADLSNAVSLEHMVIIRPTAEAPQRGPRGR